jgi:hypothetical protein
MESFTPCSIAIICVVFETSLGAGCNKAGGESTAAGVLYFRFAGGLCAFALIANTEVRDEKGTDVKCKAVGEKGSGVRAVGECGWEEGSFIQIETGSAAQSRIIEQAKRRQKTVCGVSPTTFI